MSVVRVNGVELYYELSGSGEPLVLVHGSWGDHHNWDPVVPRAGRIVSGSCLRSARAQRQRATSRAGQRVRGRR
jgi:pimeloyl-ACP methyl ester carboxylesterase